MKNIFQFSYCKVSCFILIAFLCSSTYAQWYQQQSGTTANLRGVWFADSLNGWACGDSGIVLHTSNGGQVWERQNTFVSVKFEDVFFFDSQNGWIAGNSGIILHTTNGGSNWSEQQSNVTSPLNHVQFVSPLTGFASGEQSTALETFDGGLTWQVVSDSGTASIIVYWIQQGLGTILISDPTFSFQNFTVDGGMTWFPGDFPVIYSNDVCGVRAVFPNIVHNYYWDVGIHGKTLWISINEEYGYLEFAIDGETEDTLDLNAVSLERGVEPLRLWAVGDKGWIINSVDTGKTWQTIPCGIIADLHEVSFPTKNNGWAVGDSGTILKYDHTSNVYDSSQRELGLDFYALNPYPNPFNPETNIEFYTVHEEKVMIEIYNLLGQKVETVLDNTIEKGKHIITFKATGLPAGIYFCRLSAGRSSITKKMILVK